MAKRPLISALKALLCLGLIVASAVLTVNYWINTDAVKGMVEDRLSAFTARPVHIQGRLGVALAWQPTVVVGRLVVSGADRTGSDLIAAREANLTLGLGELLSGRLSLERIALRSVIVNLETGGPGGTTWPDLAGLAPEAGTDGAGLVGSGRLYLEDVRIKYRDRTTDKKFEFHIARLQGRAGPGGPIRLESSGSLNGQAYQAALAIGRTEKSGPGSAGRTIRIHADLAGASLDLDGAVAWPPNGPPAEPDYQFTFKTAIPDAAAITALTDNPPSVFPGPVSLSGRVRGVGLELTLEQIKGAVGPVELSGAVDLSVRDETVGLSRANLIVNGGRVSGSVAIGRIPSGWEVKAALQTSGLTASLLPASVKAKLPGLPDEFGRLDAAIASQGRDWPELVARMTTAVSIGPLELESPDRESNRVCLDELIVCSRPGGMVEALAMGRLGKNKIQLTGQAWGIDPAAGAEPALFELTGRMPGAEATIHGRARLQSFPSDAEIGFNLKADRGGPMADWLGMSAKSALPLAAKGVFISIKGGWTIKDLRANLGKSEVMGQVGRGKSGLRLNLVAPILAPEQLLAAFSEPGKRRSGTVLPTKFKFPDMDVDLKMDRVLGSWSRINGLRLKGSVRRGKVDRLPISFFHGKSPYQGFISLDLRSRAPVLSASLTGRAVDLNMVMTQLNLEPKIELIADRINFDLTATGSTRKKLADSLTVKVKAERAVGLLVLGTWRSKGKVDLAEATLVDRPGRPTELTGRGVLSGQRVDFKMDWNSDSAAGSNQSLIRVDAKINKGRLKATGRGDFFGAEDRAVFDLDLSGPSPAGLYHGPEVDLPALGPFRLTGRYHLVRGDHQLRDFKLTLGQSRLGGRLSCSTKTGRPRWAADLKIDQLQLDDLKPASKKPVGAGTAGSGDKPDRLGALDHLAAAEKMINRLSTWGKGRLTASAARLLSGPVEIGRGGLTLSLDKGRLELKPLHLDLKKGVVDAAVEVKPIGRDLDVDLTLDAREIDYRYTDWLFDPKSKATGTMSLDVRLVGRTGKLVNLPARSSGHVDFNLKPKSMEAGLIDMWFVNLFRLLPFVFGSKSEAVFNCIIGRFDLENGLMTPRTILIDTTTTRVQGEGWINLRDRKLDVMLYPEAKHPKLFSAPAPVSLSGGFDDFHAGVSKANLLGTAFKFVTSPLRAPLSRLFSQSRPADGVDVCAQSLGRKAGD